MSDIRVEEWCGHDIRFVEIDGEYWGILDDIINALEMGFCYLEDKLDPEMMTRVKVDGCDMLAVNEFGIYETLYTSRKLEARKFRRWSASVMQKLRKRVGLKGYEIMRMTDSDIQDDIDHILDTLFWDEETGKLMQSVTVQGGDVEQVPFE